ncbi:MAG: BamA/TamA family outer membrane protein [Flavobacteriales bacterium]|nr:BamA/TamA family outer membrane protein [Flavobacteriales bacterium]
MPYRRAIGYDPVLGLILGGAYFRFPLRTPGSFFSGQVQAILSGQVNVLVDHTRYGLFKRTDLNVAASFSDYFQYYFGEGSATNADVFEKIYASVYQLRPKLTYDLHRSWSTSLFADLRGRHETRAEDRDDEQLSGQVFPDENTLGFGASVQLDTRDNTFSTKKGFFGQLSLEDVPRELNVAGADRGALLVNADLRYFRYIHDSRYVLAARLSGGYAGGDPSYLFRYALGGTNTLRGFYSNRFRGSRYYAGQVEMRFPPEPRAVASGPAASSSWPLPCIPNALRPCRSQSASRRSPSRPSPCPLRASRPKVPYWCR